MKARVRVKRGVILSYNIWWEFVEESLEDFFGSMGIPVVWLTSNLEGNHSASSSHYEARAWDIRKLDGWNTEDQESVAEALRRHLDKHAGLRGHPQWKFYVVFHGRPKHYHIQVVRSVVP